MAATAGVYQPVYVTYNSKAETPQVSQRIQEDLEGKLGDEFPKGLRGIPNPDKEDSGKAGPTLEGWIDEAVQAGVLAPGDRDDFDKVRAALSLGEVLVGEPSDTIVPVRSAKAQRRDGSSRVLALSQMPDDSVSEKVLTFTHFNLGHADGVPISVFMDTDILPALDDWVVEKMVDEVDFAEPSDTEDGHVRVDVVVDWHVPHGSVTGVLPVVYTKNGSEWKVVYGADPESLEPDTSKAFALTEKNSVRIELPGDKTMEIDAKLEAGTDVDGYGILLVNLPIRTEEGTVPADPTEAGFGLP